MELKQLLNKITAEKKLLSLIVLLGLFFGILYAYLPAKHIASGSFYIKRMAEGSSNFFTYEGYYAQQSAVAYTNTVMGLFESTDLQSKALAAIRIKVDEYSLRKYGRDIKVKKAGPQLVTLTVKGNTEETAVNLWKSMATNTIETAAQINVQGDPRLSISQITTEPVLRKEYKPWYLCIPLGLLGGLATGITWVAAKYYLKEDF
jgi:capsular polysaccharide biosynthesis protein